MPQKVPIPDWHRSILDERLTEYQVASDEGEAWPRVRDRLLRDLAERNSAEGSRWPKKRMKYKLLDTVVLDRDLPQHGLRAGDLGAVVEVYEPAGLEVEFVTASGKTQALVTLNVEDVRPVQENDLVAVRSVA